MKTVPLIRMTIGSTVMEFTGEQVIQANVVEEINVLGVELPASALEFKIMLYDESFSMFSGDYFQQLKKRLPILVYEEIDLDNHFIGKFYLDEWKNTSEHEFEFRAVDLVGVLGLLDYDGNFWGTPTKVKDVFAQLLNPINVAYTLSPELENVEISGWIPPGNYREAVQQVCFAAGATVSTARSQYLVITPVVIPQFIYDLRIRDQDKMMQQAVKLESPITSIELVSHNYSQGANEETIFDEDLQAGSHKIVFEKPYYQISVNGPGYVPNVLVTEGGDTITTEGGDLLEIGGEYTFGSNSLCLELSEPGHVTITGYPWVDSKRAFLFFESGLPLSENNNPIKIESATMVNISNAQIVLDRLRDYYRQRYTQEITLLPSIMRTGNVVKTGTLYKNSLLATILKMDMNLTGGFIAKTSIRGIQPQYVPPVSEPARRPRVGIAICGAEMTRQNMFREYDHN